MAHIWQSVTCSVCFWVIHCGYSPLSIFVGGNSHRKLSYPHEYTAWYPSQSPSACTRNTPLPESQKTTGQAMGFTLTGRGAASSLRAGFSTIFLSALRKHGGPCPCCLHSWIHGKDCLIWNLTWAMRLQGDMDEGIQVGGRCRGVIVDKGC